jgi:hypothetical protein
MYDHRSQMLYARECEQIQAGEFGSTATLYTRSLYLGRRGQFWPAGSQNSRRLLDLSKIEDVSLLEFSNSIKSLLTASL